MFLEHAHMQRATITRHVGAYYRTPARDTCQGRTPLDAPTTATLNHRAALTVARGAREGQVKKFVILVLTAITFSSYGVIDIPILKIAMFHSVFIKEKLLNRLPNSFAVTNR